MGFFVLSEETEFFYKTTDFWHAARERTMAWSDLTLSINWRDFYSSDFILNSKDIDGLSFENSPKIGS
jgi:dTDP-4-dehydrorhamnose 3,5-epimerase